MSNENVAKSLAGNEPSTTGKFAVVAAAASVGAGIIHLGAVGGHAAEYPLFGQVFAALGIFQVASGLALTGWRHVVVPLVGAINAGVVGVWLLSRTVGLPIGPHSWVAEPMGVPDIVATTLEIVLVAILALVWRRSDLQLLRPRNPHVLSVAVVSAVGAIGLVTLIALAAVGEGGHAHGA